MECITHIGTWQPKSYKLSGAAPYWSNSTEENRKARRHRKQKQVITEVK